MKLYFKPGACSLSPHIVLRELGLQFELEKVDTKAGTTSSGADFSKINPKGYVPTLQLDDGQFLTEGPAIVQYIADRKPEGKLAAAAGTFERYQLAEWLNFISTELHKTFSILFNPKNPAEAKSIARDHLTRRYGNIEAQLAKTQFLLGDQFTAADAYLFTVSRWTKPVDFSLAAFPKLEAYRAKIAQRPAVKAAMEAEGIS